MEGTQVLCTGQKIVLKHVEQILCHLNSHLLFRKRDPCHVIAVYDRDATRKPPLQLVEGSALANGRRSIDYSYLHILHPTASVTIVSWRVRAP